MSGKETQTGFAEEREDDVVTVPHEPDGEDQDPKGSPGNGRQDSETAGKT
ncbi:MAG: hypothetical protein ACRYG6_15355 [Janthinobacterium lividum]